MGSIIQSVGTYSPEMVLTNRDLERILALSGQETSDKWIVERTGMHGRRVASPSESVDTMALAASKDAVAGLVSRIPPIGHVIVATNTNYRKFPNVGGYVADGLIKSNPDFVDGNISAVDVNAGCGGINFGLMYADSLIKNGLFGSVLVLGVEHLTRVTDYRDRTTCVLFGDGASAYVLSQGQPEIGFLGHLPKGDGSNRDLIYCEPNVEKVTLEGALNALESGTKPEVTKGEVLRMNGRRVFEYVTESWRALIEKEFFDNRLNPEGIPFSEIDAISPHLANLRCLEYVDRKFPGFLVKCGLSNGFSADTSNTSTASQGARVKEFIRNARQGQIMVMKGYGAGLEDCTNFYRQAYRLSAVA